MNARQAVEENKLQVKWIVERAERVSKVRAITLLEALDYGFELEMRRAVTDNQKAAIDLRYEDAKKIVKNK